MMPKLKLQYFGHLMQRADSLEKTLMLGGIGGRRRRGRQRMMLLLQLMVITLKMQEKRKRKKMKEEMEEAVQGQWALYLPPSGELVMR